MAFDKRQLRDLITRVLKGTDYYSESAVELLMLTCATESNLGTYLRQGGGGPAVGIFQMEPFTHNDIWRTHGHILKPLLGEQNVDRLEYDLRYATIMSRVHYLRVSEPLPSEKNVTMLASYWKRFYNTRLGKGTVEKAISNYYKYC